MKNSGSFSLFIRKNLFYYIVWLVVAVVLGELIFGWMKSARREEYVSVFVCCDYCDDAAFSKRLEEDVPDYLKGVTVKSVSASDRYFGLLLRTEGLENSDIVILPASVVKGQNVDGAFYPVNADYIAENFGVSEFCYYNDKPYGLKIYDGQTASGKAEPYIRYFGKDEKKEDVYLFFSRKSSHLGGALGEEYDGALVIAKTICGL